jgi:hypothetical protein
VLHRGQRAGGSVFAPLVLARDLAIEVVGDRIIDLGAGIGHLAWSCRDLCWPWNGQPTREFVCIEKNPLYVRVGRKIMPEATWIWADILDLPGMGLGQFNTAIANPRFGAIARSGNAPGYTGRRFEYHAIAVAAGLAGHGVFIVPHEAAPFRYSGRPSFVLNPDEECHRHRGTGIELESSCGIDTSYCADDWRGVPPRVEVVTCDFTELVMPPAPTPARVPRTAAGSSRSSPSNSHNGRARRVAGGISAPGPHRSGHDTLASSGSCRLSCQVSTATPNARTTPASTSALSAAIPVRAGHCVSVA